MLVYFSSVTEFTHKFVERLDSPAVRIPLKAQEAEELHISEDFVLISPSYGAGSKGFVPKQVIKFLNNPENRKHIKGVIGTGNITFNEDYCKGASVISEKCGIPVLYRLELAGTDEDVRIVNEGLDKFWATK